MHEVGIAADLAEMVEQQAAGAKVATVYVRVGALSGVVKDALLFAWQCVSNARLELEDADGRELELTALEVEDDADR